MKIHIYGSKDLIDKLITKQPKESPENLYEFAFIW